MPTEKRPTKATKAQPAKKRPTPSKPAAAKKKTAPAKTTGRAQPAPQPRAFPVAELKKAIVYYYLLSFAPAERIGDFAAASAGMQEADPVSAIPEVCRRIVAFHEGTREPDKDRVAALAAAARVAQKDSASLAAFQTQMRQIASLPARAKKENRLHRDKGCGFCAAPCRYGFFSLISEPDFSRLQENMAAEAAKSAGEQSPLGMMYGFTRSHVLQSSSLETIWMKTEDMAGLSFCLLLLAMAKSRLAMPEPQLKLFQAANQEFVRRSAATPPSA